MPEFSAHFYFGSISKPLGLKGEMVVKNLNENAIVSERIELVFLDINNQLTPFFVEKISFRKKGEAVLKIQEINSIEQSKEFIKRDIYLPNSLLKKKKEGSIEIKDLTGFSVRDKNYGDIGIIAKVLRYPQQEIFEIHFKGKEILIPASPDFIEKINVKSKTILIHTPTGLIDIYLNEKQNEEE